MQANERAHCQAAHEAHVRQVQNEWQRGQRIAASIPATSRRVRLGDEMTDQDATMTAVDRCSTAVMEDSGGFASAMVVSFLERACGPCERVNCSCSTGFQPLPRALRHGLKTSATKTSQTSG